MRESAPPKQPQKDLSLGSPGDGRIGRNCTPSRPCSRPSHSRETGAQTLHPSSTLNSERRNLSASDMFAHPLLSFFLTMVGILSFLNVAPPKSRPPFEVVFWSFRGWCWCPPPPERDRGTAATMLKHSLFLLLLSGSRPSPRANGEKWV